MKKDTLRKVGKLLFDLLFGWLKRWNERRLKAKLLLEYEDTIKKRDEFRAKLVADSKKIEELFDIMGYLIDPDFEQRAEGKSAESVTVSFNAKSIDSYENMRKKAIEYEKTVYRLFVLRQKLKLYGVDRRVRENEE